MVAVKPPRTLADRGLTALSKQITRDEKRSVLFQKFMEAMRQELQGLREANDHVQDIATTTMTRGEIRFVKRILALSDEVGPGSRQSEAPGPESAFSTRSPDTGFPEGY